MPDDLRPTWCGREATSRQRCCHKTRAFLSIKPRMFDVSPISEVEQRPGQVRSSPNSRRAATAAACRFRAKPRSWQILFDDLVGTGEHQ